MTKKRTHRVVAPILKTYAEIAALVRTTLSVEMPR
jgi:hypothetical protein